jgi:hypothetical protein
MGRDLESREDVPTLLSPNVAPDFAHHDGDEMLRCPGAKWHHAPAVLVVYGEDGKSVWTLLVFTLSRGHMCIHSGISIVFLSSILLLKSYTKLLKWPT